MKLVLSTTGAIRSKTRGETPMVQIAAKSMLLTSARKPHCRRLRQRRAAR
jgi:hypothetical protein